MAIIGRTALAFSLAMAAGFGSVAALADGVSDNVVKIGVFNPLLHDGQSRACVPDELIRVPR
jgi:hypothetical protein